ncbi:MAG TPA: alpha/beta hydrolase, partial [Spirochaetia bacterium]|nr:alpha/beta hydrolase [Spirochaetia bacterium]
MRCSHGRSPAARALIAPHLLAFAPLLLPLLAGCAASPRAVLPPEVPENPAALDAWLSAGESAVPGLIPGDEKRIVWAGAPGAATEYAISYLHGFQGSPRDYAAVIHAVAARLGANVFYQRFKGHGVTTDEIADATRDDWLADAREAMEIGRRIGGRVILAGSSMGGDLALWLAVRARPGPAALVLFS